MSATLAFASMLSLGGLQEASSAKLAEVWQSYRHAEYSASGGYVCNRRQHRWIKRRFQERFGRRSAAFKAAVRQRLEKSVLDADFIVVSVCRNPAPDESLPAWVVTHLNTYEAELAAAEQAFGISQGAH